MLSYEVFFTLKEAKAIIENRPQEHNKIIPHSSLKNWCSGPEVILYHTTASALVDQTNSKSVVNSNLKTGPKKGQASFLEQMKLVECFLRQRILGYPVKERCST
jgi:hypothetical protein